MSTLVRLVREPIDVASLAERSDADGAVCLFVGVVRNESRGRTVLHLEYEACQEMALPLMEAIVIWKKELYGDGSAWLGGTPVPPP
jgi:molybdopterin synthase catalytic subunit